MDDWTPIEVTFHNEDSPTSLALKDDKAWFEEHEGATQRIRAIIPNEYRDASYNGRPFRSLLITQIVPNHRVASRFHETVEELQAMLVSGRRSELEYIATHDRVCETSRQNLKRPLVGYHIMIGDNGAMIRTVQL